MTFITQSVKISALTFGASLDGRESMGVLTTRTGERCIWGAGRATNSRKTSITALTKDCAALKES